MFRPWFVIVAVFVIVVGPRLADAGPIGIVNAGFETPATTGFNVGPFAGWTLNGSGGGVWNINAASQGYWMALAPEGQQVAFVGRDQPTGMPASISQVLSAALQPDSTYTLTGQVGHPIGYGSSPNPDTVFTVELLAGNTVLSSFAGTALEGSFQPFQIQFDSTGSPLTGQALQIRLSSSQTQTAFDNIHLEAKSLAVPEPATWWILALGGAGVLAYRKARGAPHPGLSH
jgi:hypothetical protein